ncbi:uncharacterized protein LOC127392994 isoform X2 [Apus apus]|uniref:uncharacterized protein LOC127392994 isoform X2 n=1 Tax=Apus apus TaxID=8895 RepID=UPI0021F8D437|nr:uncharacterized protein LOC127392994 isoform X2 [Apus apus]
MGPGADQGAGSFVRSSGPVCWNGSRCALRVELPARHRPRLCALLPVCLGLRGPLHPPERGARGRPGSCRPWAVPAARVRKRWGLSPAQRRRGIAGLLLTSVESLPSALVLVEASAGLGARISLWKCLPPRICQVSPYTRGRAAGSGLISSQTLCDMKQKQDFLAQSTQVLTWAEEGECCELDCCTFILCSGVTCQMKEDTIKVHTLPNEK